MHILRSPLHSTLVWWLVVSHAGEHQENNFLKLPRSPIDCVPLLENGFDCLNDVYGINLLNDTRLVVSRQLSRGAAKVGDREMNDLGSSLAFVLCGT